MGRDLLDGGWMCSPPEELPALELSAAHRNSLKVTCKRWPRGCLPKGRVPHPGLCSSPTHVIAPGMFSSAGALPAFSPGLLSTD